MKMQVAQIWHIKQQHVLYFTRHPTVQSWSHNLIPCSAI